MRKVVGTRLYHFLYYQHFFIKYYREIEKVDTILIFCEEKDKMIISQNLDLSESDEFIVIELIPFNSFTSYQNDKFIADFVYKKLIEYAEKYIEEEDVLIAFPDEDDFIHIDNSKLQKGLNRSIFYEWYLNSEQQNCSLEEFYELVINRGCMGKILEVWKDPFYKDFILLLDKNNFYYFKDANITAGFHRLYTDNKIIYSHNPQIYHVTHHLKGIPLEIIRQKLWYRTQLNQDKDDWLNIHFEKEYKNIVLNYQQLLLSLKIYNALTKDVNIMIKEVQHKGSFFDNVVTFQNIHNKSGSKPSSI